jgi:hypothetical protein
MAWVALNVAPVFQSAGETAEAKTARLTATYESALRKLQAGERSEAEGAP